MVIILVLSSAFGLALALVLTQFGLRTHTPLGGACISVPTTTLLFLTLSPLTIDFSEWHNGSAVLFFAVGLLFPATVTLLTFTSNRLTGPNITGALGNLTPLFAVAMAVLFLGEKPTMGQLTGIATVFIGIALLLNGGNQFRTFSIAAWSVALPLLAALIRGLVQPVIKLGLEDWPNPFAAVTLGYLVSTLLILTVGVIKGARPKLPENRDWTWFVLVGLANGIAVLCLYAALKLGSVTFVAPMVACYPLFTLVLNRVIFGSRHVSAPVVVGVMTTVAGVAFLVSS